MVRKLKLGWGSKSVEPMSPSDGSFSRIIRDRGHRVFVDGHTVSRDHYNILRNKFPSFLNSLRIWAVRCSDNDISRSSKEAIRLQVKLYMSFYLLGTGSKISFEHAFKNVRAARRLVGYP